MAGIILAAHGLEPQSIVLLDQYTPPIIWIDSSVCLLTVCCVTNHFLVNHQCPILHQLVRHAPALAHKDVAQIWKQRSSEGGSELEVFAAAVVRQMASGKFDVLLPSRLVSPKEQKDGTRKSLQSAKRFTFHA